MKGVFKESWGWVMRLMAGGALVLGLKAAELSTEDFAIQLTASVEESPPQIILHWKPGANTQDFLLQRKAKNASKWEPGLPLSGDVTSYTDRSVQVGETYEYALTKPAAPVTISGYIHAGIRAPLADLRGTVILLVDQTMASPLAAELERLRQDLVGEGWTVLRHDVSRSAAPTTVKNLVQQDYDNRPGGVRSLFLFGHVPVPYSGDYNGDDHLEHMGAWAADVFYGDLNGSWTDTQVNDNRAVRVANRNIPKDGKFDQSFLPSDSDLEVGRVDLANMPAFLPKTETDLLRQYLDKNHQFRWGMFRAQPRGLVFDGFGESGGEAYAANGWRNFAPFFGPEGIKVIGWNEFFPTVKDQDFLWSYVAGGGGDRYNDCYGVGETAQFAANPVKTVFNMVFGSYFGDWDSPDNFLRAPLCASGYALTSVWAGRPHWFVHHMALGETIGYSTRLVQNNNGLYRPTQFTRSVPVALMGDPTLKMHVVLPPANLVASSLPGKVQLQWQASPESDLEGYHVYRVPSAQGPFVRLTGPVPIKNLSYTDRTASGPQTYLVRAVKLQFTHSGTYLDASQGLFATAAPAPLDLTPIQLGLPQTTVSDLAFPYQGHNGQVMVMEGSVDLKTWLPLQTNEISSANGVYRVTRTVAGGARFFRARLEP